MPGSETKKARDRERMQAKRRRLYELAAVLESAEVWVNQEDFRLSPRMNGPAMAETIRGLSSPPKPST